MNKSIMKRAGLIAASMGLFLAGGTGGTSRGLAKRQGRKVRPCVNCGKEHDHNNCYCSAQCCKEHRADMKTAKQAINVAKQATQV